ncbi:MAG: polyphosphate kinase 2 [Chloroflexi bacterium]|nr:MAG: polyphosphate kinase 2 [Chloroflexota bacterium]
MTDRVGFRHSAHLHASDRDRTMGQQAQNISGNGAESQAVPATVQPPAPKPRTTDRKHVFVDGAYPYSRKLREADYLKQLRELQIELVKVQNWVKETGEKLVVIFEGRDAAGKGGAIKRFMEYLNPRGARVVALGTPNETERGQWYFQRYIAQLPTSGEIVFFDRSWYNRAGVERVFNFCTPVEYLEFMRQAPELERMLVNSGIRLFKLYFSVSRAEQVRRFDERKTDPLKHWKLSPIDLASLGLWEEYTDAKEAMFFYTDTADAPWTIIKADDKRRARINAIRAVVHTLPYTEKDTAVACPPDPLIVGSVAEFFAPNDRVITSARRR